MIENKRVACDVWLYLFSHFDLAYNYDLVNAHH